MEYGDIFLQQRSEDIFNESPEGQQLNGRAQEVADETSVQLEEEARGVFQGLEGVPEMQDYDYVSEYQDNPDLTRLSNRNRRNLAIAGYDMGTGSKFRTDYQDADGDIQEGVNRLRESVRDNEMGAPWEDIEGLTMVASGMLKEGATKDDFMGQVPGHWSSAHKITAWNAAQAASYRQAIEDRTRNDDWADMPQSPQPVSDEPIDPDTLHENRQWLQSAETLYEATKGAKPEMSSEDLSEWALGEMAMFNWNLSHMSMMAYRGIQDPRFARALYNTMNLYDNVGVNWNVAGNSVKSMAMDPFTYVGVGAPVAAAKVSAKAGIRAMLLESMQTAGKIGAAAGAGFVAADSANRQSVGISAEEHGFTPGDVLIDSMIGGVAGLTIGTGLGMMKPLAKWGQDKLQDVMSVQTRVPELVQ